MERELDAGQLCVAYLTRFRPMNHLVVVYGYRRDRAGTVFHIYDPNDPARPGRMRFERADSSFEYPKTPYWGGGRVNLFLTYRWPLS
jgi:hypothetical protein